MMIIPALDILGGRCVRLREGRFDSATVFDADAAHVLESFDRDGIELAHVVDLDGARSGSPVNAGLILRAIAGIALPVQVGGGLRTTEDVAGYLDGGAARVVVGSVAVSDPALLASWIERFGDDRIVVALDVRNCEVAINGWQQRSGRGVVDVVGELRATGARRLLCTDIARDGLLVGPNVALYELIRELAPDAEIIASGGVSGPEDFPRLASAGADAVVVGRALYEGRVSLEEIAEWNAVRVAAGAAGSSS